MIYGTGIYGSNELFTIQDLVIGTWYDNYTFSYMSSTTVMGLFSCDCTLPEGSELKIEAGESLLRLYEIIPGVETAIQCSGDTDPVKIIYLKVTVTKNNNMVPTAIVNNINFDISQSVSMYTIADSVLRDANLPYGTQWEIDDRLRYINVPISIINPQSHYNALEYIAKSCGAIIYEGRDHKIRVRLISSLTNDVTAETILANKIYELENATNEIKNRIIIEVNPIKELASTEVWRLANGDMIFADEVKTYEAKVTDYIGIKDGSVRINYTGTIPATIESVEYMSWGARITVKGGEDAQTIGLFLDAKPLAIDGKLYIDLSDNDSILANGERVMEIKDNLMIQSKEVGQKIAEMLLNAYKTSRRDMALNWRGNPALEVGDKINVIGYDTLITSSEYEFNGALRARHTLRRLT